MNQEDERIKTQKLENVTHYAEKLNTVTGDMKTAMVEYFRCSITVSLEHEMLSFTGLSDDLSPDIKKMAMRVGAYIQNDGDWSVGVESENGDGIKVEFISPTIDTACHHMALLMAEYLIAEFNTQMQLTVRWLVQ